MIALKEHLKRIVLEELLLGEVSAEHIQNDTLLFGPELSLDSFDALELVYLLDTHFGVTIKDQEEARAVFQSIETIAAFVESNQSSRD